MPLIEVTMLEGRSPEAKRAMMKEITEAAHRTLDAPLQSIRVVIREVPAAHWAIGGEPKG